MNASAYLVGEFEEFWPHYVRMHTRPATQLFHAAGSLACIGLFVTAALTRTPAIALLGPPLDYGLSQASHHIFERNRTTPWKNQVWHARAEVRMLWLVLTLRMRGEVARQTRAALAVRSA